MTLLQFIPSIAWTAIMAFAYFYVKGNKKFPVTRFDTEYRVDISPSLAWEKGKILPLLIGFVCLVIMWIMTILVSTDIIGDSTGKSKLPLLAIYIPLAASVAFFFASYSSRLSNYSSVSRYEFERWERERYISSEDNRNYVDVNGKKLERLFDKPLIR